MKISGKLQAMNIALILSVLITTLFAFHLLYSRYMLNQTKKQMAGDAATILRSLRQVALTGPSAGRLMRYMQLRQTGQRIDSKIAIFNADHKLIYTNANEQDIRDIVKLEKYNNPRYLIVRRSIEIDGTKKGSVIVAAKIRDIQALNRMLTATLLFSILIGALIALFLGWVLGRKIARPILELSAGMRKFSLKDGLPKMNIRTGDELKDLSDSFMDMAGKLQAHDRLQMEFLQNASHELKTPLMAIQGNAEAIKDGIVPMVKAGESLDTIIAECQRLKTIVDELIYLSKLEQHPESGRVEGTSVCTIAEEAVERLQGLAQAKGIGIKVTGSRQIQANLDRERFVRALLNIMGNALRYAKSAVHVEIIDNGKSVEVVCSDDGSGFAPGETDRVFDRFYKGENGGTGIGLAIARAIVEAHGGAISAGNRADSGGARVRISLPKPR